MERYLALQLACGGEIAIQDRLGVGGFGEFADMLGCTAISGVHPVPAVELRRYDSGRRGSVIYTSARGLLKIRLLDDGAFEAVVDLGVIERHRPRMRLWHYSILCAGVFAVLRGIPAVLMHGAALMHGDSALLLCGESGIGKSTTAARWEKLGRRFAADDMFLLEYGSDAGFCVHALPTWSRCAEAPEAPRFPVGQALPVSGVLGLARGGTDERVEEISSAEFFGQIVRSAFFHCSGVLKQLPEDERLKFCRGISDVSGRLAAGYPPCGLFAALNGDLERTIENYYRMFGNAERQ